MSINGSGSAYGMIIQNSNAHFKIMDSTFYGSNLPAGLRIAGLILDNTYNGIIFKNQFLDNGLVLPTGPYGAGISVLNSENNIIKKNTAQRNVGVGIYLDNSDNNVIVNNYVSENMWGIMLWDYTFSGSGSSDNNIIIRNEAVENIETGIVIGWSYGNTVTKNLVRGNYYGISIGNWAWSNKVTQNDCNGNSMGGIILHDYSMYNEIKGNDCYENANGIILINNAMDNKIEDNVFKNNNFGISVGVNSYNNEIKGNDIIENWETGIVLYDYPWGNVIYHNNIIDNVQQAWDDNPWSNNWNENYWSDYPGTDIDGDGLGDTYLPWPIWPYFGWDGYDYTPFVEENGWEDDNLQEDVVHAFLTNEQRLSTGIGVENSISELNYLIVGFAATLGERRYFEFSPPYTCRIWLDGEEIELSSFWWDDKEGEKIGEPAFMRIYYHIFEPYSLQDLELGWHTVDFELSIYAGNGPYRYLETIGWSSGFILVE